MATLLLEEVNISIHSYSRDNPDGRDRWVVYTDSDVSLMKVLSLTRKFLGGHYEIKPPQIITNCVFEVERISSSVGMAENEIVNYTISVIQQ